MAACCSPAACASEFVRARMGDQCLCNCAPSLVNCFPAPQCPCKDASKQEIKLTPSLPTPACALRIVVVHLCAAAMHMPCVSLRYSSCEAGHVFAHTGGVIPGAFCRACWVWLAAHSRREVPCSCPCDSLGSGKCTCLAQCPAARAWTTVRPAGSPLHKTVVLLNHSKREVATVSSCVTE